MLFYLYDCTINVDYQYINYIIKLTLIKYIRMYDNIIMLNLYIYKNACYYHAKFVYMWECIILL